MPPKTMEEILKKALQWGVLDPIGRMEQTLHGAGEVLPYFALGTAKTAERFGLDEPGGETDRLQATLARRREETAPDRPGEGVARMIGRGGAEAALGGPRAVGQLLAGLLISQAGKDESTLGGVSSMAEAGRDRIPGMGAVADATGALAENPATRAIGEAFVTLGLGRLIGNISSPRDKLADIDMRIDDPRHAAQRTDLIKQRQEIITDEMAKGNRVDSPVMDEELPQWAHRAPWYQRLWQIASNPSEFRRVNVDRHHPLLLSARGLAPLEKIKDLEGLARGTTGADAVFGRWMLTGIDDYGTTEYRPFTPGLKQIIDDVPDVNRGDALAASARAFVLDKRGKTLPDALKFTYQRLLQIGKEAPDQYMKYLKDLHKYTDGLVEVLDRAGLVDDVDELRAKNPFYVPFYHVDEGPAKGAIRTVGEGGVKRYAGTGQNIMSPLESLISFSRYTAGLVTRKALFDMVEDMAGAGELRGVRLLDEMPKNAKSTFEVDDVARQAPDDLLKHIKDNPDNRMFHAIDGSRYLKMRSGKVLEMPQDLWESLSTLSHDEVNLAHRAMRGVANVLKTGVTVDPVFSIRNTIRDTLTRTVLSENVAVGVPHPFKGIAALDEVTEQWARAMDDLIMDSLSHTKIGKKLGIKARPIVAEFELSGNAQGNLFGLDQSNFVKYLDVVRSQQGSIGAKARLGMRWAHDALRNVTTYTENATRLAEYKSGRKNFPSEHAEVIDSRPLDEALIPEIGRGNVPRIGGMRALPPGRGGSNLPARRGIPQKFDDLYEGEYLGIDPSQKTGVPRTPIRETSGRVTESIRAGAGAADVTTDFRRIGEGYRAGLGRFLKDATGFWNPKVQGLDRLLRVAYDPRTGKANKEAIARVAEIGIPTLTVPALTLYKVNRENPDWQNLPDVEKALQLHVPLGNVNTPDELTDQDGEDPKRQLLPFRRHGNTVFARIPMPWELGWMLATGPIQSMWAADPLNPRNTGSADRLNEVDKQQAARVFGDLIPMTTGGNILYQLWINEDTFRNIPIEDTYEHAAGLAPEVTGLDNSSALGVEASNALSQMLPEAMTPSPPQVDFLARASGGQLGRMATEFISKFIDDPDKEVASYDLEKTAIKAFFTDSRSLGQAGDDFYNELARVNNAFEGVEELIKNGYEKRAIDKLIGSGIGPYEIERNMALTNLNSEIGTFRNEMNKFRSDPDLTEAEKRVAMDIARDEILWRLKVGTFNRAGRARLVEQDSAASRWAQEFDAIDDRNGRP